MGINFNKVVININIFINKYIKYYKLLKNIYFNTFVEFIIKK